MVTAMALNSVNPCLGAMDVKPHKFEGFGDVRGPKPFEFILFGAVTKPFKSIRSDNIVTLLGT